MDTNERNEMPTYKGTPAGRGVRRAKPIKTGDLTAVLDLAIDCSTRRMGRPANYTADAVGLDEFVNKSIDFFQYVRDVNADKSIEQKVIPDVESWALFMGITRQTIFNYERRGGEWPDVIAYFKNCIAACKKQLALHGQIPPVVAIFDLANNHQYLNTSEFRITTAQPTQDARLQALETEIKAAGLVWNESAGEFEPI